MIYLFAGDDVEKKIKAYDALIDSFGQKFEIFNFNRSNWSQADLESFFSGEGLFFNKCIVLLHSLWEEVEQEFLKENLSKMFHSANLFILFEGVLDKKSIEIFKKAGAQINIYDLTKEQHEKYNNFLLAFALADRDKVRLWIHYRQAVNLGVSLEELVGVLFWKAKDLLLQKKFFKFSETELKKIISELSFLLPKARKEGKDAEVVLEKFLLETL